MSHHPERTARNVRPVNQPPSFHYFAVAMLVLPCLDKGTFYNGSEGGTPIFVRFRHARLTTRPETAASRGFYPIPRSVKGLKSRKAL